MMEFVYTYQNRYGVNYIKKLVFVKETASQIVAFDETNPLNILRFNKSDGKLRAGSGWHPTKIIDYETYVKLHNEALAEDIERFNKELLALEKKKAETVAKLL